MEQMALDLTKRVQIGEVRQRILDLWDELEYNGYARVNSVKKKDNLGVESGSLQDCGDVGMLLKYEQYLMRKKK